ncbi:hypothetical protein O181_021103 [Austropuccinia psidii MF-1]|uniref:Uncharacterized protein n=1 Tax=Austropuccinia psidii MF-1 TaxID=1389203 RepID=A0A9Q3GV47_9BASI|nr:hypothetical protein [Austropuccinia psidii MF-1]
MISPLYHAYYHASIGFCISCNPLQSLTCLHSSATLKICLCRGAPISPLTHPHASAPPPLNMLMLPLNPQGRSSPILTTPSTCLILSPTYHPDPHVVTS